MLNVGCWTFASASWCRRHGGGGSAVRMEPCHSAVWTRFLAQMVLPVTRAAGRRERAEGDETRNQTLRSSRRQRWRELLLDLPERHTARLRLEELDYLVDLGVVKDEGNGS